MTDIALDTLVRRTSAQVSCELDGEVAILNLESTQYFGLDEVGAVAWQRLAEPCRARDVCNAVSAAFEVDRARCETDVLALLAELREAGLVAPVAAD